MENTSQIAIQPVSSTELAQLSAISREAYLDHFRYLWTDQGEWYTAASFNPGVLQSEIRDPDNRFFIAVSGYSPVGFLKLRLSQPVAWAPDKEAIELERIYLLASAAGRGFGKTLLQFCFDFASQFHKEIIWLKAMDSSRSSIAFYLKNGFEICGTHRLDFPLMKEEFRGMVVMTKDLC